MALGLSAPSWFVHLDCSRAPLRYAASAYPLRHPGATTGIHLPHCEGAGSAVRFISYR